MPDNFEHKVHEAAAVMGEQMVNVLYMLDIFDKCENCYHFNKNIHDEKQKYECFKPGSCIAATIHPDIQNNIWDSL